MFGWRTIVSNIFFNKPDRILEWQLYKGYLFDVDTNEVTDA